MKNIIVLFFIIPSTSFSQIDQFMNDNIIDLINPGKKIGLNNWNIVNDDVMGGVSTSNLSLNQENSLIFNGYLSLDNNGGFASSRLNLYRETLNGIKSLKIVIITNLFY